MTVKLKIFCLENLEGCFLFSALLDVGAELLSFLQYTSVVVKASISNLNTFLVPI